MSEETIRELTQVKMQYEFDKKEKIREEEQYKREIKYGLIILILAIGFILTGLLYSLLKSRTKRIQLEKRNLEQDLEIKNKELTTNVMYLLKKNEFMVDISSRLMDLKSRMKTINQKAIHQVIFDIQSATEENVWEEFEMRFQHVHNDFFKKLNEFCPELSPVDVKICAFLRLNMSTKEISAITHISGKTIDVTRSKIRKKLNLTHTDTNLISFLNQF